MSKIKNGALNQYGTETFKQQQVGTAGVERVKRRPSYFALHTRRTFCEFTQINHYELIITNARYRYRVRMARQ